MDIRALLAAVVEQGASDLHVSAGLPAWCRLDGELVSMEGPVLTNDAILPCLYEIMTDCSRRVYETELEVDFAIEMPTFARFRVNAFVQSRGVGIVFRVIPFKVPEIATLGLPAIFKQLISLPRGLVLVTGPSGSGKSTTLAAMVNEMNTQYQHHILTIEDPIEYVHVSQKSLMTQREVPVHTRSFAAALRSALREDPDVILVGELRDLETIRLAITAAETGHLVLGTLHTNSAAKTIDRLIDVFKPEEKSLIRTMLAESLQAVVSQVLVKKIGGGRVPAFEIMRCTAAIRHLIRENKVPQLYSAIQTGQSEGMQTLERHLMQLLKAGVITENTAQSVAAHTTRRLFAEA